jgi:hypothetical protein
MAQKKVQPGVAYTKSGEKKISGSANSTPTRQESTQMRQTPAMPNPRMSSSIKSRSKFDDQSSVDSLYRWK